MTEIEKRLLTCRLLEAMSRHPEYSKKIKLEDKSYQNKKGEKKRWEENSDLIAQQAQRKGSWDFQQEPFGTKADGILVVTKEQVQFEKRHRKSADEVVTAMVAKIRSKQ